MTVVVPTRGRAAYLEVTLDSLGRQRTRTPHELLVVDDGATDATPEVAERFGVRLIRHGERRSLNAARNTGLREASADLIAFVDDDVLVPPGLARRAGGRRSPPSGGGGVRRADPGALRGPRAARLRPRGPADHDARPRAGGRGGGDGVGRELRRAALGRRADRRVRRDARPRPRRRGGLAPAAARSGRPDRVPGRRRASTTAAAPATPDSARSPGRPTTAGAERVRATCAAATPPASRASCACWPAAAGTPCAGPAPRE